MAINRMVNTNRMAIKIAIRMAINKTLIAINKTPGMSKINKATGSSRKITALSILLTSRMVYLLSKISNKPPTILHNSLLNRKLLDHAREEIALLLGQIMMRRIMPKMAADAPMAAAQCPKTTIMAAVVRMGAVQPMAADVPMGAVRQMAEDVPMEAVQQMVADALTGAVRQMAEVVLTGAAATAAAAMGMAVIMAAVALVLSIMDSTIVVIAGIEMLRPFSAKAPILGQLILCQISGIKI